VPVITIHSEGRKPGAAVHTEEQGNHLIDLQHINVKFVLEPQEGIDLGRLIPVFHGWIQEQPFPELLIDVADYSHVPSGPGLMIIGHEADYSVDNTDGRLGVCYARKETLNSSNQERLKQAARSALNALKRLEENTALPGKLKFGGNEVEVVVNDRLLAPNRPETQKAVEPEIGKFADEIFGPGAYQLTWQPDPRRLLGVTVKANRSLMTADILKNLT